MVSFMCKIWLIPVSFLDMLLQQIAYQANHLPCDLHWIDIFVRRPPYVHEGGDVLIRDPVEEQTPISFTNKRAYVSLPMWEAESAGSFELNFKTVEPNTIIMYNGGKPGSRDFVAIETYDGVPYFVIDTGLGEKRYPFNQQQVRVDDGEDHFIKVDRNGASVHLTLDDQSVTYNMGGVRTKLDLGTNMYLGAVDVPQRLPWHVWTRRNQFFQGCMWGLKINDGEIDLARAVEGQSVPGVQAGCMDMSMGCLAGPCSHGVCHDRFPGNSFYCDCSDTPYTGPRCSRRKQLYPLHKLYIHDMKPTYALFISHIK